MNISPLVESGVLITNVQAKANFVNVFYAKQCCSMQTGSFLTNFQSRPGSTIEYVAINRQKVLIVIQSLDASNPHTCHNISIAMVKICDSAIVWALYMILEKIPTTANILLIRGGARKIHWGFQVSSCRVRYVNSNVTNRSYLTSFKTINQLFFRCRSSIEKHFQARKYQLLREIFGGLGACRQKNFQY